MFYKYGHVDMPASCGALLLLWGVLTLLMGVSCMMAGCSGRDTGLQGLDALDHAISQRPRYHQQKEARIDSLRGCIATASTPEDRFHALGHLLDEYISYNTDTARVLCERRLNLASELDSRELIVHGNLSKAHVLSTMGFYKEAIEILDHFPYDEVPEYLRVYYSHINRTIYGFLAEYGATPEERVAAFETADAFRDSLLKYNDPASVYYKVIKGDQLNVHGQGAEAVKVMTGSLRGEELDEHNRAIIAYTLAQSYKLIGDKQRQKEQLIISATNDIKTDVKEYVSLRELALLLYEDGDVDHAYDYLNICMADAQECNARLRILEINDVFPVVNEVYLNTIRDQQRSLGVALAIVGMLAMGLILTACIIYREKKKVDKARLEVADMNRQLHNLNDDLRDANDRLKEANQAIIENSYLKNEFIARYMDRCTIFIDQLDKYRKTVNKIVTTGDKDALSKFAKSLNILDDEVKAFYRNFDETFLKLFPTFIEDFNSLLQPDEIIVPRNKGALNTELRIFALIRLGISDSVKIAKFLRYSTATIYSYRTKVRNKARGDRDMLEKELMDIGKIGE